MTLPLVNEVMPGWLECNGARITSEKYPELVAVCGETLPTERRLPCEGEASEVIYVINARRRDDEWLPGMIAPWARPSGG